MARTLANRIALLKQTETKALNNLTQTQRKNETLLRRHQRDWSYQEESKPIEERNVHEEKEK
jgi:hypothetical protein